MVSAGTYPLAGAGKPTEDWDCKMQTEPVLSLQYRNMNIGIAALTQSLKPGFKLINNTNHNIRYSDIKVRYWFTQEEKNSLNATILHSKIGITNVLTSFTELTEPHEGANFYMEFSFAPGAGLLMAKDTTRGFIITRVRKDNWTKFNESNDYSYYPHGTILNERISVYLNNELVWGVEPSIVPKTSDLKLLYSHGGAPADDQIPIFLRFFNDGNTSVYLSDISFRYWFKEEGSFQFNFIENYLPIGGTFAQGAFENLNPEREGANHDLHVSFISDAVIDPFSSIKGFKFKIIKGKWRPFNNKNDDYSYIKETDAYTFLPNEHITLYLKGILVAGIEPQELAYSIAETDVEEKMDINLYPIPAKEALVIETQFQFSEVSELKILDLSGIDQYVPYLVDGNKITLNTHKLSHGLYILRGIIDNRIFVKRIEIGI